MIKIVLNILIFLLQLTGAALVGFGVEMIWEPLGWIYSGAVLFVFGHLLYQVMESEEIKK